MSRFETLLWITALIGSAGPLAAWLVWLNFQWEPPRNEAVNWRLENITWH